MFITNWSAKQKRLYHRLTTLLTYWESNGYQIIRLDLTSSKESNWEYLRKNHRELRRMVEVKLGYPGIEDFVVETKEGNGTLHVIWAWKPAKGFKNKSFYVPYWWLSMAWICLHKAWFVSVRKYDKDSSRSKKRLSRYIVSHYLVDHEGGDQLVRYSYSWRRSLNFPLVKFWRLFSCYWLDYARVSRREMHENWGYFLSGYRLADVVKGEGLLPNVHDMRGVKVN